MTRGLELKFHSAPPLSYLPPPRALPSNSQFPLIHTLIPKLLSRGIIRKITSPQLLFFSQLFVVPKKDNSSRLIIDLSLLNKFLIIPTFKMETVAKITLSITEALWGCTLDITDAYFHLPLSWEFQMFFAFVINNIIYVFQYLPFGLSPAPWAFSRVMKPIKGYLHKKKIMIYSFLDDFCILHQTPSGLEEITTLVLQLLKKLGLQVNFRKSNLVPSQKVEYLGIIFHLDTLQLSLPQEKIITIISRCQFTNLQSQRSRRQLESLLGLLNFAYFLVPLGRLRLPLIS